MTEESTDTKVSHILENERIPAGGDGMSNKPEPHSKANKTRKKKKKTSDAKDDKKKDTRLPTDEPSKRDSSDLSPDEQLRRELDWCIEQLELGLRSQKTSDRQREEASRAVKTLRSSKAPLVKKRQVMRSVSGDYRLKMQEEQAKQFRLIQTAVSSSRVADVSQRRPVFYRLNEKNRQNTRNQDQDPSARQEDTTEAHGHSKHFVLAKTQQDFCFNFQV